MLWWVEHNTFDTEESLCNTNLVCDRKGIFCWDYWPVGSLRVTSKSYMAVNVSAMLWAPLWCWVHVPLPDFRCSSRYESLFTSCSSSILFAYCEHLVIPRSAHCVVFSCCSLLPVINLTTYWYNAGALPQVHTAHSYASVVGSSSCFGVERHCLIVM